MNNTETTQWIKDNARLITYAVNKFGLTRFKDEAFDELYNQAVIAIYRAGKTFNPSKKKASTYMLTVIRNELCRYQRRNIAKLSYPIRYYDYVKYQDKLQAEDIIGVTVGLDNLLLNKCNVLYEENINKLDTDISVDRYMKGIVMPAYKSMTKQQRVIIDKLYNIKNGSPTRIKGSTYVATAKQLDRSTEYIRQTELRLINKIKNRMRHFKVQELY